MANSLLIASSPVEIEAKCDADELPPAAQEAALALFHALTDHLGKAARARDATNTRWPTRRFYFAASTDAEMAALLDGLRGRQDYREVVADEAIPGDAEPNGLFVEALRDGFTGVLVGHESHAGAPPPSER